MHPTSSDPIRADPSHAARSHPVPQPIQPRTPAQPSQAQCTSPRPTPPPSLHPSLNPATRTASRLQMNHLRRNLLEAMLMLHRQLHRIGLLELHRVPGGRQVVPQHSPLLAIVLGGALEPTHDHRGAWPQEAGRTCTCLARYWSCSRWPDGDSLHWHTRHRHALGRHPHPRVIALVGTRVGRVPRVRLECTGEARGTLPEPLLSLLPCSLDAFPHLLQPLPHLLPPWFAA